MTTPFRRLGVHVAALPFLLLACAPESGESAAPTEAPHVSSALESITVAPALPLFVPAKQRAERSRVRPPCPSWRSIVGTWHSHSEGLAIDATRDAFVAYEVSEHSCFARFNGPLGDACRPEPVVDISSDEVPFRVPFEVDVLGQHMLLRDSGGSRDLYVRTESLPLACRDGETARSDDPIRNFDLAWEHMNEHYAFFDLHGVDWAASYRRYRPQIDEGTTPAALFEIITEMLSPLRDYHVSLTAGDEVYRRPFPADITAHYEAIGAYVQQNYVAAPNVVVTGQGLMAYQLLEGGIGYVIIGGMESYAEDGVLSVSRDGYLSEIDAAGAAVDEALAALSSARALIIDVRFNPGGLDVVASAIAARFADRTRLGWWSVARDVQGTTWPQPSFVARAGSIQFNKPVAVLTSRLTLSAAEMFVLAMRVLPHAVVIGERTAGSHSTVMTRQLANGWELGLSNEVYYAADGQVYERIGIPPDVEVALEPSQFARGRDAIFEAAIDYLETR